MVTRLNILAFAFLLFLISCNGDKKESVPEGIISETEMIEILTDVHLIEGARTGLVITGDSVNGINEYYKALFEQHGVTQAEFDSSFVFYAKRPIIFDKMYEKVIENLSMIETELKE